MGLRTQELSEPGAAGSAERSDTPCPLKPSDVRPAGVKVAAAQRERPKDRLCSRTGASRSLPLAGSRSPISCRRLVSVNRLGDAAENLQ